MTELEKSFNELLDRHIDFYEPVNGDDLACFFNCTLQPEHMKHTEEVKGLIENVKLAASQFDGYKMTFDEHGTNLNIPVLTKHLIYLREKMEEALKPFEKETGE